MNRWIFRTFGIGILAILLLVGLKQEARAQQGQESNPDLDRSFNLDSYQGLEEIPRMEASTPGPGALGPASPQISVPWSQIVFQSARSGNGWELFLADGSGANQVQLTWNSVPDIHARLNHGCTKIVYASKRPPSNYNIYTMNLDSSGDTQLTSNVKDDVYPAWSPDGAVIAFQSYRNGNPEIYLMNADGSNQTRLTNSPGYDGTPAWSPDGRIVFASDRVGLGGIWVMNADGSGLTQLAGQPYSIFPAWSPDGSQIAYSADNDGDNWLEMWLMNADGSNQHQLLDLGYQKDAWVRSWSPDSQYIAYTQITFIVYQGNLYWTNAYLYAWDVHASGSSLIMTNDTEWHPDWQTTDALPPVSSMTPLPAQSPALFQVSWSGYENGPTGIRNYDIQVKDGAGGAWADWLMGTTSPSWGFQGLGGHTYYFRIRARDNGGNLEAWHLTYDVITTVESLPPQVYIKSLPRYFKRGKWIEWAGSDPGGSGIKEYDVQYRVLPNGNWVDLAVGTLATSETFLGDDGSTYTFRIRATDNAENQGLWSAASGGSTTIVYEWGIYGTVYDNAGAPVENASVNTTPQAFVNFPSDEQGNYTAYLKELQDDYPVSWAKLGYGNLPETRFAYNLDKPVNMVLPPADNIVQNWGFEDAGLASNWLFNGQYPAVITDVVQHTGTSAARVGAQSPGFATPVRVSTEDGNDDLALQIALDKLGVLHAVWQSRGGMNEIQYARKSPNASWNVVESVSQSPENAINPQIGVDNTGTVHVVWYQQTDADHAGIYYSQRPPSGAWSAPYQVSAKYYNSELFAPQIAVSSDGFVHVFWSAFVYDSATHFIFSTSRGENGAWSTPIPISDPDTDSSFPLAAADASGNVHVVWRASNSTNSDIYYALRNRNGIWSTPYNVTQYPPVENVFSEPQIAVEGSGAVHIVWTYAGNVTYYIQKKADGTWISPEVVPTSYFGGFTMNVDQKGNVHTAWYDSTLRDVFYAERDIYGGWSSPVNVSNDYSKGNGDALQFAFGADGTVHLVWTGGYPLYDIFYARRGSNGEWTAVKNLSNTDGDSLNPKIVMDNGNQAHVIFNGAPGINQPWYIWYVGPSQVSITGDSMLSQAISLPPTLASPTLSFLYQLRGASAAGGNGFSVLVNNGSITTTLLSTFANTTDWTHAWFDLSPWLSQSVTLTFNVHETAGYPYTWAYLDEVTVGSAHPDVWVSISGGRAATPGQQITLQLTYGNRSPAVEALSATITATLPAGLIFDSANITPTVNGNVLTWSVGDLPAGSGPITILVTASVADDAAPGSTLTLPVEITSATPELELLNNQEDYALFIGGMVYLPVTVR